LANEKIVSLIAGGAGFIGVNLAKTLIELGHHVVIGDNLSLGSLKNIKKWVGKNFKNFIEVDLSSEEGVINFYDFAIHQYGRIHQIWHLAANSDIPSGIQNPNVDLKDTFMTTFSLLEGCKKYGIKKFNFASSSAVYGDWGDLSLHENLGPLTPISNYGAMKAASEAQVSAAKELFLSSANIFRFPNVVGVPATHGIIIDLIKKLKENSKTLNVLGDGSQKKSYLHVSDLVSAMIHIDNTNLCKKKCEIINIGSDDDGILIRDIAEIVVEICSPEARILYGAENRGWVGDVPKFSYDISKLKELGWIPKYDSYQAVVIATKEIYSEFSS